MDDSQSAIGNGEKQRPCPPLGGKRTSLSMRGRPAFVCPIRGVVIEAWEFQTGSTFSHWNFETDTYQSARSSAINQTKLPGSAVQEVSGSDEGSAKNCSMIECAHSSVAPCT